MATEKRTLQQGFMLAQWRVEPLKGQITAPDGSRRHVAPKAMDVLLSLARQSGQIVSRARLLDEVWGALPRSDEALTHCVSELRHALGDRADDPAFLQTVPRQGYRLIAPVTLAADTAPRPDVEVDAAEGGAGFLKLQLRDLRKRHVFQTAIGYPVLAWLLVEVVDVIWDYLLQPLGGPAWLVPSFVVLLALGYPIAVFLSWAVDVTPQGVRLTPGRGDTTPAWGLAIVGIASIAITAAALFAYFNAYETPEPEQPQGTQLAVNAAPVAGSIAVLRFLNISENPAITYLSDGLTEELIHELTNLKSIKVAARTSAWPLSTARLDTKDIASRLRVEKVLEGSVRADGDRIRVTAQLVDNNGFHIWSQAFDRRLDDILVIQKEIAAKVAAELGLSLTDESQERLERKPTINSSAYDQYLLGRAQLRQPKTAESLKSAQALFENAVELDDKFPLAYAGLCETHLANYGRSRATQYFTDAESACHRAMDLDDGLAEVYTALGNLYRESGQFVEAERQYRTALAINPTFEDANYGLGAVLEDQGRLDEAEQTLLRSIELEPGYYATYLGVGNFLHRQARYAEAIPYYEKVTELAPDYADGFINLGSALHWLGEWDAAEVAWRRSVELAADATGYENLGTLYYYQHRFAEAAEAHRKAVELAPSDHRHWGKLAAAQRYVPGQESASLDAYRRAIELVRQQLEVVNADSPDDLYLLGDYLVNTGDLAGARKAIERSLSLTEDSASAHYFAAILELNSGNEQKALAELEKACDLGYSYKLLAADPEFDTLRPQAAFTALLDNYKN
jgi:TolB-like protein/DNA-binding winged helix-turn-helix (wHTH) protein/Tfp pilus assembly protein PilF